MRKLLFVLIALCSVAKAQTFGTVVTGTSSGVTTVSTSGAVTTSAGGALIVTSGYQGNFGSSNTAALSGCSGTVAGPFLSAALLMDTWLVTNTSAGSCTPTATWTGGTGPLAIIATPVSGLTIAYTLSGYRGSAYGSSGTLTALTTPTEASTTLLYCVAVSASSATLSAAGYTSRASVTSGSEKLATFDATAASTAQQSCPVGTVSGNSAASLFALRTVVPTQGWLETTCNRATSVSSTTIASTWPEAAGDTAILDVWASAPNGYDSNIPTVSDSNSDNLQAAPVGWGGSGPQFRQVYLFNNMAGGSNTYSIVGGTSQGFESCVSVFRGESATFPIAQASMATGNNLTSTPISVSANLNPGNYDVYLSVSDPGTNNGYAFSSGWTSVWDDSSQQFLAGSPVIHKVTIQHLISGLGSLSATITKNSGTWGNLGLGFMVALSPTANTAARVLQIAQNGGTVGITSTDVHTAVPVHSGNLGVAYCSWNGSTSSAVPTSSLGNLWSPVEGCSGTNYCLATTTYSSTGQDVVSFNPSNNVACDFMELSGFTGIDPSHSSSSCTSCTTRTASMTAGSTYEMLESFGGTEGVCNPAQFDGTTAPNWYFRSYSGAHCASVLNYEQFIYAGGTYSNTLTTLSTSNVSAAIIGFISGVPPGIYDGGQITANSKFSGGNRIQ